MILFVFDGSEQTSFVGDMLEVHFVNEFVKIGEILLVVLYSVPVYFIAILICHLLVVLVDLPQ